MSKTSYQTREEPLSRPWQTLTLREYVQWRNGVPLGHPDSLRNMLDRSLGATTFTGFWQYWNPIWSYGLGKYVYVPLRQVMPTVVAFTLTFVISGALHDAATMLVRRGFAFFFTPWFFLLALGAVAGRALGLDLSNQPWWMRAASNIGYLLLGLLLTFAGKQFGLIR